MNKSEKKNLISIITVVKNAELTIEKCIQSVLCQNYSDIEYIINVYKKLIEYDIDSENAKMKLANINYEILNDFDSAYNIYDEIEKKSSKISIDTEATLGKINILISKGYLDSAQSLINNQKIILEKFTSHKTKQELMNKLKYKNTQILFYKGEYQKMSLSLDSLIKIIELDKIKTPIEFFNNIEMKVLIYGMSFIEVILLFVAIILATWIILSKHDNWKC